MNINQLNYFISVAEYRSFTKAATQYYVSQTAVTQQIQNLEEQIGTKLIDRTKRPIELTAAGEVFLREAKALVDRMEAAVQKTRNVRPGAVEPLRIGYTKGYECSDFPKLLRTFHHQYPEATISCYRNDTDMLAASVLNGDLDIIFTWDSTNIRHDERVETVLVEEVQLMAVVYRDHPLAQRRTLSRSELRGERLVFMSPSNSGLSFGDDYYIQLYQDAGYEPDIFLRTSDMESALLMIQTEMAVSILPAYCISKMDVRDSLSAIPLRGKDEIEEIIAVWRKDNTNIALRNFVSYLDKNQPS